VTLQTPKKDLDMKWSIHLGHWFGIPVYLHFTFLLMLGFLALANGLAQGSAVAAVSGAAFFAMIFVCVLLHEFGHALMARRYGVGTKDITLLPIGGVARLERMPEQPAQEFWIAVAGPAVNVVIAAVLAAWLALTNHLESMFSLSATTGSFAERLLAVNLLLVLFNLLPAFPMDGGRVLRSLLAMKLDYAQATGIAGRTGQGMAILFALVGLFWNPMLLFIALFVWLGASQEMAAAQTRSSLEGVTVGQAMVTDYRALTGDERLDEVARLVLAGSQQDFPVIDRHGVAGLVERKDLFDGLSRLGPDASVRDVMRREFPVIDAGESVDTLLAGNQHIAFPTLPVVSEGRMVGLLTAENLSELLLLKSALDRADRASPMAQAWRAIISRPPPLPGRA
jgi:Zn-dependent protease